MIEECLDEFGGRALLRGRVTHIGGGTEGGKGQTPVQELYINVKGAKSTKGAAYPDASFAIMAEKVRLFEGHVNSVSVRKTDGEMTADELRRFRNLGRLVGEDKAFSIPKLTESENDELQTRRLARAVCKEVANSLETQIKDFQRRQAEQQANQGEAEGRK